jgi:hypothetical protein
MDQIKMNKTTLALMIAAALGLAACSSSKKTSSGVDPGEITALQDRTLSTDFSREGIRITYTLFGSVKKIEAFGYAPVWRGNYEHVAEADAKDKLVRFLRGETVTSNRMTRVIARSIERSQDRSVNRFRTVDGSINFTEEELDSGNISGVAVGEDDTRDNTALRRASVANAQIVTSTITVTAKGRLSAVFLERSEVVDDGRTYLAVYAWTPKTQDAARGIREQMDRR